MTRNNLVARAPWLVVTILAFAAASGLGIVRQAPTTEASDLIEVRKLLASDGEADDEFGVGVAVSGDVAVVGAWQEDAEGDLAGAAYVHARNQGGDGMWGEVRKLVASDAEGGERFGHSVAIEGDTVVVGADGNGIVGDRAGAVYIFQQNVGGTNNWGEVAKLTPSDGEAEDHFGYTVAVSGDTVVVGARLEDTGGDAAGAAYVFDRDEGGADNWGEVAKLTASDAENGDQFGYSVAVDGDTVLVGAWLEDEAGTPAAGAAYLFERDEGGMDNWGEMKKLTASDAEPVDRFGSSVAISGDTALAGAYTEDSGFMDTGAAYLFDRDEGGAGNWGETQKLAASDSGAGGNFGHSVAVVGDAAAIGGDDGAYLFHRQLVGPGDWTEVKRLLPSSDEGLFNVALSGDVVIVGAGEQDSQGQDAGAAMVFRVPLPKDPDADPDEDSVINTIDADDDNDGCGDLREDGKDPLLGGLRDPHNEWDFYDVPGLLGEDPDGVIDLSNDILGVVSHYAPTGSEPAYDVAFDRGPTAGPNPWNMTAPDGVIDLSNDILGVISQHGHDCR